MKTRVSAFLASFALLLSTVFASTLPNADVELVGKGSETIGSFLTRFSPLAGDCSLTTMSCNTTRSGSLSTSDCTLDDGSYLDFWEFSGTAGSTVTIELSSSSFDTYLVLIDPDIEDAVEDDDSGTGTNSRIVHTLNQTGTWVIAANSRYGYETGTYTLKLACTTGSTECNYALTAASASFGASGGSSSVGVSGSPSSCTGSWGSQSNASWISITSGASGSGSGSFQLGYSVQSNGSSQSRTGTMTVANRTFTVTQAGATLGCTPTSTAACMLGNRFRVEVLYRNHYVNPPSDSYALVKSVTGFANPKYETAFFYFNSPDSIEILLKLIDQSRPDGRIDLLYGSSTPLELFVTVTDTKSGLVKSYHTPRDAQSGVTEFAAFPP